MALRPFQPLPPLCFTPLDLSLETTPPGRYPETTNSSDLEKEKCIASGEDPDNTTSAHHQDIASLSVLRPDSTKMYPLVRCRARTVLPPMPLDLEHQATVPSSVHPALRAPTSSGELTFSMIEAAKKTQRGPFGASATRAPATLPPNTTSDLKAMDHKPQARRKLSTTFRVNKHEQPNCPPPVHQAETLDKPRKLDILRQSLSNLSLARRIRQLAGTKRARPVSPDVDAHTADTTVDRPQPPPHRIPRPSGKTLIHCQTCQCRTAVEISLARMRLHDSQESFPVLSPPKHLNMCTHPEICGTHSSVYQNDDALARLEGRGVWRENKAPEILARRNPNDGFSDADKRRLLECVVAYEGIAELE